MRTLLLLLTLAISPPLAAAELFLDRFDNSRHWSTEELLAHPQAQDIRVPEDVSYKHTMRYRAVPLTVLLQDLAPDDQIQLMATDGFAAELPAASLLNTHGARAWLAIEDPSAPWPNLGKGKASAGPFYLVWTHPKADGIAPEQWPFQVIRITRLAPLAQRFPGLLPDADASPAVQAGFNLFRKHCMACHRLNRQGNAQLGPDLNLPYNPTEYFRESFLLRYIRDPQSLRQWPQARMPAFSQQVLNDTELGQLLAYLRHMASRKSAVR